MHLGCSMFKAINSIDIISLFMHIYLNLFYDIFYWSSILTIFLTHLHYSPRLLFLDLSHLKWIIQKIANSCIWFY